MKKFIVSQDRRKIVEVHGSVYLGRVTKDPETYNIVCAGYTVAKDLTEQEAYNQLSLIAAFLNTKNTLNEAVYFMPAAINKSDNEQKNICHCN